LRFETEREREGERGRERERERRQTERERERGRERKKRERERERERERKKREREKEERERERERERNLEARPLIVDRKFGAAGHSSRHLGAIGHGNVPSQPSSLVPRLMVFDACFFFLLAEEI